MTKSPLKGSHNQEDVWYWFIEGYEGDLSKEQVIVDNQCSLPEEIFRKLSIENLVGDGVCMYFSKDSALDDLHRAVDRIQGISSWLRFILPSHLQPPSS